jgi:hypothetical protein
MAKAVMRRKSDELLIRLDENVQTLISGQETFRANCEATDKRIRDNEKQIAVLTASSIVLAQEVGKLRTSQGTWNLLNSIGVFVAGILGFVR